MPTYTVTYTHNCANGIEYPFTVDAPNEEMAAMRAGMARAESFEGRFIPRFFTRHQIRWTRLSVKEVE